MWLRGIGTVVMFLLTALLAEAVLVLLLELANGGHWPLDPFAYLLVVVIPPALGLMRAYRFWHASEYDRRLQLMRPLKGGGILLVALVISSAFVQR